MCKKPQIVPAHTSCQDIWKDKGPLIDVAAWITDKDLGVERGIVNYKHASELLNKLYEDEEYRQKDRRRLLSSNSKPSYRWDKIAEGFTKAMELA